MLGLDPEPTNDDVADELDRLKLAAAQQLEMRRIYDSTKREFQDALGQNQQLRESLEQVRRAIRSELSSVEFRTESFRDEVRELRQMHQMVLGQNEALREQRRRLSEAAQELAQAAIGEERLSERVEVKTPTSSFDWKKAILGAIDLAGSLSSAQIEEIRQAAIARTNDQTAASALADQLETAHASALRRVMASERVDRHGR